MNKFEKAYGFDEKQARSRGGADGIFLLDRHFTPKNEMMKKLFDGFLDQPNSGIMDIAAALGVAPSGFSRLATTWSFVSC
ncbi:hypothetical protein PN36_33795 [Candidatus Thiomargarita nelsonii]|uniref:Uncharacterized protein n=1 Tax=Candidatus Thiomargarita nelsonii TaxID=1003181 RepID=A0A4E0QJ86_9GAMM|nr:hypothetical protein PN36_33795 [Candidatus Thiomargarita nelsonii]